MDAGNDSENGNIAHINGGESGDAGSGVTGLNGPAIIGGIPVSDPGTATGGGGPRKRGRPAGSTSATKPTKPTKEKATPASVVGIEKLLFSLHTGMSSLISVPELEISKDESKMLSEAIADVAQHYNVVVDPKVMAWAGFAGIVGALYGPRFAAWRVRVKMEKSGSPKKSNVVPMTPSASPMINGFPLPGQTG